MICVTEGELLTECNNNIDARIKWTINYVLIVRNNHYQLQFLELSKKELIKSSKCG